MRFSFISILFAVCTIISFRSSAQTGKTGSLTNSAGTKQLFVDVHRLEPGKVKFANVAGAHAKDLATQKKYDAKFLKYWVNEEEGLVYCLVSATDSNALRSTHAEAHGLMPSRIYPVSAGTEAALKGNRNLFLDVHYLGAGAVTAKDVAAAHEKDLAVQKKHGVNLVNYWVDQKEGVVMCLAEAKDSAALIETHKEAHGLIPARVIKVKEGR